MSTSIYYVKECAYTMYMEVFTGTWFQIRQSSAQWSGFTEQARSGDMKHEKLGVHHEKCGHVDVDEQP